MNVDPLRLSLDVACPRDHAFDVWTLDFSTWWPVEHTVSGDPVAVVLEPRLGGRIYERARDGAEHVWGKVTQWDPPVRLGYTWHLGRPSDAATEVLITFTATAADSTTVAIEHTGWQNAGADPQAWRDRNRIGWTTLLPHFSTAIGKG